ncbi:hypothetical protein Ancab_014649 [Ancistrocladus abbreviatus]
MIWRPKIPVSEEHKVALIVADLVVPIQEDNQWLVAKKPMHNVVASIVVAMENDNAWDEAMLKASHLISYDQCLHYFVELGDRSNMCVVTFVYASNSQEAHRQLWQQLIALGQGILISWLVLGDFNFILSIDENEGGLQGT